MRGKGKYEYDEIRYTYKQPDGQMYSRLSEMAYYLAGKRAMGPNGFSYFICDYTNESTRTDTFYRVDGQEANVRAADPFLSSAVIPALYSFEYPYLTGIPNLDTDSAGEAGADTAAGPGQSTENQAETPQNDPNAQASYRQQEDPSQEVYNDYNGDDGSEYGNEDY
jgi:hypothetical protein